jgi:Peptidase A4 family
MRNLLALTAAVLATAFAGFSGTARAATSDISTNWAGFAVNGTTFSAVSGSWVQPKARCTGGTTSAAFWVGLGGNSTVSNSLEQIGTSSDCSATGTASYSAWYELVPAGSVPIKLKVSAGNTLSASVKVNGTKVTVQIQNLTRKTSFTKVLTMAAPDVSSAEWIAEAPSVCDTFGRCRTVPLTNFGKVSFSKSLATAAGHAGTVSDSLWTATAIQLQSAGDFGPFASATSSAQAVPTGLSSDGSAFTVSYAAVAQTTQPNPFSGGGNFSTNQ